MKGHRHRDDPGRGPGEGSGGAAIVMALSSSHKLVISHKGLHDWLTRGGIQEFCRIYAHFALAKRRYDLAWHGSRHDPVRAEGAIAATPSRVYCTR
ncbi:MAG: hypothetical protein ABI134_21090, partial [Byssovorax sp.]